MYKEGELVSFLDLLDLDEEVIDLRAKSIMQRSNLSSQHLEHFIYLLQYKHLINVRENSEYENEEEYNFLSKLIVDADTETAEATCTIVNLVLTLNPTTIINKSEHLLQQILSTISFPPIKRSVIDEDGGSTSRETENTLVKLKICGSVLDAVKKVGARMSLPFLLVPLEQIICTENKQLQGFFLMNTVPKFFETVDDYNILDRIWCFLKQLNDSAIALKVLCSLSNYYLPVIEDKSENVSIESTIIRDGEFWDFILNGLLCDGQCLSLRKQAIYLAKRGIDYLVYKKKDIQINSQSTFTWSIENENAARKMWENYFILIDSLEEKQSNIVLPSLKLFNSIHNIGHCWLAAAFKIGLKHDNFQVRQKCLNYRFQFRIRNQMEAVGVLEALNDSAIFDNRNKHNLIIGQLKEAFSNVETLINFLQGMADVKLSPVPLFSLTSCLAVHNISLNNSDQKTIFKSLNKILKTPCNNIVLRKAIYVNMSHFIVNCCKNLHWKEYLFLYLLLDVETSINPFVSLIQNHMVVPKDETEQFINTIRTTHLNIPFALIYFRGHDEDLFLKIINDMIYQVKNISSRQYSNKLDYLEEAIFIAHLYKYQDNNIITQTNYNSEAFQAVMQYIMSLLSDEINLDYDKMNLLLEGLGYIISGANIINYKENLIQLYKTAEILVKDNNSDLQKKLFALLTLNTLLKSKFRDICYEVLVIETFVNIIKNINCSGHKREDGGRLRNSFYENICQLLCTVYTSGSIKDIIYFIDTVVECGGHGCLKWLLILTNKIISELLEEDQVKFDLTQFLNKMWKEIEDLKSNSQYSICMEQFINLLTHDAVLKRPIYNNLVISYCNKIINYATLKYSPLYFLIKRLTQIDISSYAHMIYVLCEILLYANIPNKEQRIAESLQVAILERSGFYGINEECVQFNSHIQYLAVSILVKISDNEILVNVMKSVRRRIDELMKNKLRYHENSYLERSIESGLQCLLLTVLMTEVDLKDSAVWCMELLGRMPHQPYVRICLEWFICLYFYLEKHMIGQDVLDTLNSRNVPIQSQFMILYWILIRKIKTNCCLQAEFDQVMEFLTSHSMGPVYGVRLYAQYLATKIIDVNDEQEHKLDDKKFTYIIKVIRNCLRQAQELEEKSLVKLLNSYFINSFDIIQNWNFYDVYYKLPVLSLTHTARHFDMTNKFLQTVTMEINASLEKGLKGEFLSDGIVVPEKIRCEFLTEVTDEEESDIIQKKYVPWKSMSDVDVYSEHHRPSSGLVLVASLVDKLPNLGGMARTGEVFGVHTYIMDSLRHVQNRIFQDLSVSAERWLNVEEVRPGEPLKRYLMMKKAEGHTVVAAEQTSNSVKLQHFKFPKKTVLLLGHEKEGISCDLLPLCDICVEVPQLGVVRSLNVHVTAALFVWEYTRQHLL
ncbi:unnamed protein product [Danaus chrysippus]|uniref:(African queen) hypothetical protein n=1 Tax=Danaus chrysippus TaxID=151541 RepID=A0A8J2VVB6_9NEOP|nr:unnamed protein product [Danaus chrysippus]